MFAQVPSNLILCYASDLWFQLLDLSLASQTVRVNWFLKFLSLITVKMGIKVTMWGTNQSSIDLAHT